MADFSGMFKKINSQYDEAVKSEDSKSYANLSYVFRDLNTQLREYIQKITKNEIVQIVKKLKSGRNITKDELRFIKLWIVGDADYYAKMENNFHDWSEELKRLIKAINELNTAEPDFVTASRLRGVLTDGARVLGDIAFFFEQKDRIKKFEEACSELDSEERELLISLLEKKMASADY